MLSTYKTISRRGLDCVQTIHPLMPAVQRLCRPIHPKRMGSNTIITAKNCACQRRLTGKPCQTLANLEKILSTLTDPASDCARLADPEY